MTDDGKARVALLVRWISRNRRDLLDADGAVSPAKLTAAIGRQRVSYWSDVLALTKSSFGASVARSTEAALEIPHLHLEGADTPQFEVAQAHRLSHSVAEDRAHHKGGEMRLIEVEPGYVRLPVLAEAAAGSGRTADGQELVEHVDVAEDWVRRTLKANPANVRVVTARGHSMTGVIEDGDVMFVVPAERFDDDGIYVIAIDDMLRVKRLNLKLDGTISIESNDGRAPETMAKSHAEQSLRVCGRVIGAWSLRKM